MVNSQYGGWMLHILKCRRLRRHVFRAICCRTKWISITLFIGLFLICHAYTSFYDVHVYYNHEPHRDSVSRPQTNTILEDFVVPNNSALGQLSGKVLSSFYYRYVNRLQVLCPVKDIFGGIHSGLYVCQMPTNGRKCNAFLVTKKTYRESRMLSEINEIKGCRTHLVEQYAVESSLKDKNSDIAQRLLKATVDLLVIDTGSGGAEIADGLLTKGYLRNVQQIVIKIDLTIGAVDEAEIRRRLILLRMLYEEGFRIYHKERSIRCVYRRWYTACYTVYMIRSIPVEPPIIIPPEDALTSMAGEDLLRLYHRYAVSTQVLCHDVVRVGHIQDGGWDVCMDAKYKTGKPCLVYSFGIAWDWSFDDEMAKIWDCQVHSFDPSIGRKDFNRSAKVSFHNLGIAGADGRVNNWNMMTLSSIINMLRHNDDIIDIVKMDVEGAEWRSLTQILDSGVLHNVRQLFVEFHFWEPSKYYAYLDKLIIFRRLYEQGMRQFWSHPNQVSINIMRTNATRTDISACYEVSYININL